MALTLLVVLATAHLENFDLIVATVRHYRSLDLGTFDQRCTKFNGVTSAHCEHLIESDFGTNVSRYLFYFEFFASSNLVLFAAGFYDRVHVKPHRMFVNELFLPGSP